MDEVAAFRFGSVKNSYAGKKGDDRNVGVIGVAVFEERGATFPGPARAQPQEPREPLPRRLRRASLSLIHSVRPV